MKVYMIIQPKNVICYLCSNFFINCNNYYIPPLLQIAADLCHELAKSFQKKKDVRTHSLNTLPKY